MNEEIDQMILSMLQDAAGRDLSEEELKQLDKKVQVFRRAKDV